MNNPSIVMHHPTIKAIYDKVNVAYFKHNPDLFPDPTVYLPKVLNDTNTIFDLIGNAFFQDDEQVLSLFNQYGIDYIPFDTVESIIQDYANFLESLDTSAPIGQEPSSRVVQCKILSDTGLFYLQLSDPSPLYTGG